MRIFDLLTREAQGKRLEFLVIGGHAIIAYGISRNTLDLDLLISRKDRTAWKELFEKLEYSIFHEHENFLQFSPHKTQYWPIDLMLVDEASFRAMLNEAKTVHLDGSTFQIPKIEHVIALKLHSYKSGPSSRDAKDLLDILELARVAAIDMSAESFKKFCLQYVSLSQYEAICKADRRHRKS